MSISPDKWIDRTELGKAASYFQKKTMEKRAQNDRVWTAYNDALRDGKSDDEARHLASEIFGWSDRRINNLVLRRIGTMSEKTRVAAQGQVIGTIYFMCQNVNEIAVNADEELDELEGRNPDDWVDVEQTETTGGKFDTTQTKKMTVRQARRELEDRKLKAYSQFVDAVAKLTQRNIVNVNIGDDLRTKSLEDINAEMELLEKQMIKGERESD